ncbi:MAG: hypothetical protein AB1489_16120 [Acidobacteriota bacterium]
MRQNRKKRWIILGCLPLLGTAVFGFVSVLGFSRELAPIWKARASQQWPSTNGSIIEASVFYISEKRSPRTGYFPAGYLSHLRYKYSVDGK